MRMISPDGISHSFDASANGYGRGEGVVALVVKPLRQALLEGDNIRAVIRGTGVNHDGRTPSITSPNQEAQAALIRATYRNAGLRLDETTYFEAHGTGTEQGVSIALPSGPERSFEDTADVLTMAQGSG